MVKSETEGEYVGEVFFAELQEESGGRVVLFAK